jgi:hypothetical protein
MPSKSKAQHNFMAAVANNPSFAKKAGVPQSVGKEFSNADKGRKFSKGGDMKAEMIKKGGMPMKMKDGKKVPIFMNKGGMAASKMGAVKTGKTPDGVAVKGKTKGTMIAMKHGGKAMKSGGKAC